MSKPAFDPSKPFEAVNSKPAFDPAKPFEAVDQAPSQSAEPSDLGGLLKLRAKQIGNEFVNQTRALNAGLTGGLSEPITSGVQAGLVQANKAIRGEGLNALMPQALAQEYDRNVAERESYRKANPFANTAMEIVGAANPISVGTKLMSGATKTARVLGGSALGGMGAASKALENRSPVNEAAKDVGIGMATGAAIQGGIEAAPAAIKVGKDIIGKVGETAGRIGAKIGSAFTGVSEQDIKNYASRNDEINRIIKESGGVMTEAADNVRSRLFNDIKSAKNEIGKKISQTLDDPKFGGMQIDASKVTDAIDHALSRLSGDKASSVLKGDQVRQLNELKSQIQSIIGDAKTIDLKTLNSLKQNLQDIATPAYDNAGRAIFQKGDIAANAAKAAAAEARVLINSAAPEIKAANDQLAKIHKIESKINKNLFTAGTPDSALFAAGSGANPRNGKMLSALDKVAGTNSLEQAQNLSAARSFANPAILPVDATGKSATRVGVGSGLGFLLGGYPGAVVGGAMTSPAAMKMGIDSAIGTGRLLKGALNLTGIPQGVGILKSTASDVMATPEGRAATVQTINDALQRRIKQLREN